MPVFVSGVLVPVIVSGVLVPARVSGVLARGSDLQLSFDIDEACRYGTPRRDPRATTNSPSRFRSLKAAGFKLRSASRETR